MGIVESRRGCGALNNEETERKEAQAYNKTGVGRNQTKGNN